MGSVKRGSGGKGQRMDLNLTPLTCRWVAASVIPGFNLAVIEYCGDCIGDSYSRRSRRLCYFGGNLCMMPNMAPLSLVLFFFLSSIYVGRGILGHIPTLAELQWLRQPHTWNCLFFLYHSLSYSCPGYNRMFWAREESRSNPETKCTDTSIEGKLPTERPRSVLSQETFCRVHSQQYTHFATWSG